MHTEATAPVNATKTPREETCVGHKPPPNPALLGGRFCPADILLARDDLGGKYVDNSTDPKVWLGGQSIGQECQLRYLYVIKLDEVPRW